MSDSRPPLGLADAVSVIVGIVVGASIYQASPLVFRCVGSPAEGLLLWAGGGGLMLIGAFCYAELAVTYPRSGGDYVYLSRAYGPWMGFLFGWAHMGGILTGSIAAMAVVFARYAARLGGFESRAEIWLASGAIAALTLLNILGVTLGKIAQNVLTVVKVIGLGAVIVAGLAYGSSPLEVSAAPPSPHLNAAVAMILILYAYGGWNEAAFVTAEVRDVRRNLPRALLLGMVAIIAIYLLVNLAYLRGLGFAGLRASDAPAADALVPMLGRAGEKGMSLLVIVSTLGALNGMVFTGSRVHATLGSDYRLFAWLGRWNPRFGTPVASLLVQSGVALALIALLGTPGGRQRIDRLLAIANQTAMDWDRMGGAFDALVAATAPVFWLFFLLTGASLIVLRIKDPDRSRPFRAPLFPLSPLVFCGVSAWMLYRSAVWAGGLTVLSAAVLSLGVPAYLLGGRIPAPEDESAPVEA